MRTLSRGTIDEAGHAYGRLKVVEYAGLAPGGKSAWLCECECGETPIVRGDRLRTGRIVSCGCWRADPNIRQAARLKVRPALRKRIARLGASARKASRRQGEPDRP